VTNFESPGVTFDAPDSGRQKFPSSWSKMWI